MTPPERTTRYTAEQFARWAEDMARDPYEYDGDALSALVIQAAETETKYAALTRAVEGFRAWLKARRDQFRTDGWSLPRDEDDAVLVELDRRLEGGE